MAAEDSSFGSRCQGAQPAVSRLLAYLRRAFLDQKAAQASPRPTRQKCSAVIHATSPITVGTSTAQPRAWQDPRRQAQACQQIEELRRFCGPDMALLSVGGVQTADHLRARMSGVQNSCRSTPPSCTRAPGSHAGCCGSASSPAETTTPRTSRGVVVGAGKASQLASHSFDQKRSIFASACSF